MFRKKVGLAAAGALIGLSASFLAVAPAQAVPTYCSASSSGNTVTAYCYASASGSQFRAVAQCRYVTPTGSYDYNTYYGPWRVQGDPPASSVSCPSGWSLNYADAQVA